MKFTLDTGSIQLALSAVMSAVPTKSSLPILGNILIEADSKSIKFSTTDLEISVTTVLAIKAVKKGSIAIPAKTFHDIISALPQTEVDIEAVSNRLELRFSGGDYKISGMSADEFPKLPEVNSSKEIRIPAETINQMIQKTSFAVSGDETRPALNGVLWQTSSEKMVMVATDGHRLSHVLADNTKLQGLYDDVIIPPRALNLVSKLMTDTSQEVGIIFGENNIIFRCENNTIYSRIIEGPYPNYEQVIPKDNDKELIVNRSQLIDSVRRVAILANSLTHQVKFSISKDSLELSATNVDVGGEASEKIPCQYDSESFEVGYNANYVIDVLKQVDGEDAKFTLASPVAAAIITPTSESCDYLFLLMPLRLAE